MGGTEGGEVVATGEAGEGEEAIGDFFFLCRTWAMACLGGEGNQCVWGPQNCISAYIVRKNLNAWSANIVGRRE